MSRRGKALLLAVALGAPLAACSDDEPGEGEARLRVDGAAYVDRADGDRETVDESTDLASGDRVTIREGAAVMELAGGTTFELREGRDGAENTKVLMAARPVLEAGDLLVTTPGTARLEADGTEVDITDGAARVTRAFGMSVSAYNAYVRLDSAGALAEIPALRRMAVPDLGRPPAAPRPVEYDRDDPDPWDLRFLAGAMAMGGILEGLAEDLTDLVPEGEGRTEGFFKLLLPTLEDEDDFTRDLVRDKPDPGETFIGAAIAVEGSRGEFRDRWGEVFEFRDDGADWGLVAVDQGVRPDPLIPMVEEAFNTSFDEIAQGAISPPPDTGGTDGGTDSGLGGDGGTDGTDGGGTDGGTDGSPPTTEPTSPPPTTPPVTPPVEPPEPPDAPDELDPVIDPVVDLVDDLLGGLLP